MFQCQLFNALLEWSVTNKTPRRKISLTLVCKRYLTKACYIGVPRSDSSRPTESKDNNARRCLFKFVPATFSSTIEEKRKVYVVHCVDGNRYYCKK